MPDVGGIAGERLRSFIERIERLEEERRALGEDIKEVYSEAKSAGFDLPTMRQIVRIRKMDQDDRDEKQALLDTYMNALGMRESGENEPQARFNLWINSPLSLLLIHHNGKLALDSGAYWPLPKQGGGDITSVQIGARDRTLGPVLRDIHK